MKTLPNIVLTECRIQGAHTEEARKRDSGCVFSGVCSLKLLTSPKNAKINMCSVGKLDLSFKLVGYKVVFYMLHKHNALVSRTADKNSQAAKHFNLV